MWQLKNKLIPHEIKISLVCRILKKNYFCSPIEKRILSLKILTDEKDISAIKQKKKKQTRVPRKNVYCQWP